MSVYNHLGSLLHANIVLGRRGTKQVVMKNLKREVQKVQYAVQ